MPAESAGAVPGIPAPRRSPSRDAEIGRALMVRWVSDLTVFAAPSVRLADPKPDGSGWINHYGEKTGDVRQAEEHRPVAMELARRIGKDRHAFQMHRIVFDLDAKLLGAGQVAVDEAVLSELLAIAGITAIAVTSGSAEGGRHLWASCPRGVPSSVMYRIAEAGKRLCPTLDKGPLSSATSAARPPGAPHRGGGRARLDAETPADVDEAIRLLRAGSPRRAFEHLAVLLETAAAAAEAERCCTPAPALIRGPEPEASARQLRREDGTGRPLGLARGKRGALPLTTLAKLERELQPHEDHSAHANSTLISLILAGWQWDDVAGEVETAPGLEYLRSLRESRGTAGVDGYTAAGRWILPREMREEHARRQFERALIFAQAIPLPEHVIEELDEERRLVQMAVQVALELVDRAPAGRWGGRFVPSGQADLAILEHSLRIMLRVGRCEVELPVRDAARRTLRHHSTAAQALKRHNWDAEYLVRTAEAEGVHAAFYGLAPEIVIEARRRLAALDAHTRKGLDHISPERERAGERAGQHILGGAAAAHGTGPTQEAPPPPQGPQPTLPPQVGSWPTAAAGTVISGLDAAGLSFAGTAGALVTQSRAPYPRPGDPAGSHALAGASAGSVTTLGKQDHPGADHDQLDFAAPNPSAALARLSSDLRILGAELFTHRTGRLIGTGRHSAYAYLALRHAWTRAKRPADSIELARATGQRPGRVTGYLTVLSERALVVREGRRGWVPTGLDVREVDQGPLAGLGARRAREHEVHRLVWGWLRGEQRFLGLSLEDKRAEFRAGRRRQPYGQGWIGEVSPEALAQLSYPRRAVAITPGRDGKARSRNRLDHAEAARLVRLRLTEQAGERAPHSPTPRPPRPGGGAEWNPDLRGAPAFAIEGVRAEQTRRRTA